MKIAIDVDEVLSEIMIPLLDYYNSLYNKNIQLSDLKSVGLDKYWEVSAKESITIVENFFIEKFDEAKPIKGSIEGVKKLKNMGHELFILSARPINVKEKTIAWINEIYGEVFTQMFFTDKFSNPNAPKKSEIMKQHKIDLLIDDDPNNCFDAANKGFQAILLNIDNRLHYSISDQEHKNVTKAYSWDEAILKIPTASFIKN